MKLLDIFLTRKAKQRRAAKRILARYDAAQVTPENARHWANADGLSAKEANRREVRDRLRRHSRYEASNNSFVRGMVDVLANDIVGTGPRLQFLSEDSRLNREVERQFWEWARRIGLAEKMQTMIKARVIDGEAFAVRTNNNALPGLIKLDVRLVECDQVQDPTYEMVGNPREADGILFDQYGNPSSYKILDNHPGDGYTTLDYTTWSARNVTHLFKADRPGQVRGIPETTPALPLFAIMRRFTLATLSAAETAANFAAILQTNVPVDEAADVDPMDVIEIERNMMMTVPEGWGMEQFKAEHPTTTYKEFRDAIINEAAVAMKIPFNVAIGNSSGFNYASGRLDHQTYFKWVRGEQESFALKFLDSLFQDWLQEAVRIPDTGLRPLADLIGMTNWRWFWDGQRHVDPQKEANAQATRLENGTTTYAAEFAAQGLDWETQFEQLARERARMRELGIQVGSAQSPSPENEEIPDPDESEV